MFSKFDDYERFMGRWSRRLAPELCAFADVCDGDVVLDVGCGTGALSQTVADRAPSSRVVGVDASQEFIAYTAARTRDPRVRFEAGDAQALRFDDATFDKTLSLLVMNFIPDAERALGEMARVTREGGVVAAAVWDYSGGMDMLRIFWSEAVALDPTAEPRDEAHMPLCKPGELGALWQRRGFSDVRESPLTLAMHFASFDDYWAPFSLGQGPAGAYVSKLPLDRKSALEARLRTRLLGSDADRAIELRARAWAVRGTVV